MNDKYKIADLEEKQNALYRAIICEIKKEETDWRKLEKWQQELATINTKLMHAKEPQISESQKRIILPNYQIIK